MISYKEMVICSRNQETFPILWALFLVNQSNFSRETQAGMSFNRSLWKLVGRQIGREARAAMNVGNAFSTFWAPVINLARDAKLQFISWSCFFSTCFLNQKI